MASVSQSGVTKASVHSKVPCAGDTTGTGGRPTFCGLSRFTLVQLDPRIATSPDARGCAEKNEKVVLFFASEALPSADRAEFGVRVRESLHHLPYHQPLSYPNSQDQTRLGRSAIIIAHTR
jgi:hypothetical protein